MDLGEGKGLEPLGPDHRGEDKSLREATNGTSPLCRAFPPLHVNLASL